MGTCVCLDADGTIKLQLSVFYTVYRDKKASEESCPAKFCLSWIGPHLNKTKKQKKICFICNSNFTIVNLIQSGLFQLVWVGKAGCWFLKAGRACAVRYFFNTSKKISDPHQQKTVYVCSGGLSCESVCLCVCVKCLTVGFQSVWYSVNPELVNILL